MNATSTVLSTKKAVINGKLATVQTIKETPNRVQDISYTVNGQAVSYNGFWSLNPRFKN